MRDIAQRINFLLFDLDGTLVDSRSDLINSVNALLEGYGCALLDGRMVIRFIGRGARNLLARSFEEVGAVGISIEEALSRFKRIYSEKLTENTTLYPGMRAALEQLDGTDKAVISNKPEEFSRAILDRCGIAGCFREVVGGDTYPEMKPSPVSTLALMHKYKANRRGTLLVGDSLVDAETARNAGIGFCAALYGFEDRDRLLDARPDFTVETASGLLELPVLPASQRK